MDKKLISCSVMAAAVTLGASLAQAAVVESFDTGAWGAGWSNTSAGTVNAGAAHDGAFGVSLNSGGSDGGWSYNTSILFSPGDTLSAWIRPKAGDTGRVYLGFGADSGGAESFVAGNNTNQIIFQDNASFGFSNLTTAGQSWTSGKWYRLEVSWSSLSSATGNLYDSDGTTLLNSLAVGGLTRPAAGIALRGFGGWDADTITINSAVPEPETYAMMLAGLGLLGLAARRRKQKAV